MEIDVAMKKISEHKQKLENDELKRIQDNNIELKQLKNEIRDLKPRIEKIIKIGNICIDNNIILNKIGTYNKCLYKEDNYETDAIYHQLGFYPNAYVSHPLYRCTEYQYIGFVNGGANGNKDFITNGDVIKHVWFRTHEEINEPEDVELMIYHCRKFLDKFPIFEKKFYEFIDNL